MAFTYLKVIDPVPLFTSGGLGLGLVILVLVLRIWSCLHHCIKGVQEQLDIESIYNNVFHVSLLCICYILGHCHWHGREFGVWRGFQDDAGRGGESLIIILLYVGRTFVPGLHHV